MRERTGAEKGAHRGGLDGVDDSRLKVEEHSAGHVLALAGLVVEDVDAVELSIVVAGVGALAVDAVLVADDFPELGAHLVAALSQYTGRDGERREFFGILQRSQKRKEHVVRRRG